jgi:hypothetical protein
LVTARRSGRSVIKVRSGDTLVYRGWIVDVAVLDAILDVDGDRRLLWRFTRDGGRIQPEALTERQVIWLDDDGREG